MAESKYKLNIEKSIYQLSGPLITHLCQIPENTSNYNSAIEYVLSNLKYHTFLNPLHVDVQTSYANIIEKLRINSQTQKAERLEELVKKFEKIKLRNPKGVLDLNDRLLDLVLKLSTTPLDSGYIPVKGFEKVKPQEIIEIQEKFEKSPENLEESESDKESESSDFSELSSDSEKNEEIQENLPTKPTKNEKVFKSPMSIDEEYFYYFDLLFL